MSCYDPESPRQMPQLVCDDCPMAGLEQVIYEYKVSGDLVRQRQAVKAQSLLGSGVATCDNHQAIIVERGQCHETVYRRVCSNPNLQAALGEMGLRLADRRPCSTECG